MPAPKTKINGPTCQVRNVKNRGTILNKECLVIRMLEDVALPVMV